VDLVGSDSNTEILLKSLENVQRRVGTETVARLRSTSRQKQTRLTREQVSELIAMHHDGMPIDEIAATFRVHRTTVMAHLDRVGVERRSGIIKGHLDEARTLYEPGSSLARVAEHFGVDAETVRRSFKNAGMSLRARRGWQS
jgi:transposase-like protein